MSNLIVDSKPDLRIASPSRSIEGAEGAAKMRERFKTVLRVRRRARIALASD
jgi:hypothetical protein